MENLESYPLERWPFQEHHYISDLIDFEGPILVHYQNEDKHALYYWVEGNSEFNRWLCFNITVSELHDYLYRKISLYELIKSKKAEAFFTVDIDANLNYTNFQYLDFHDLPASYYPDPNSYFLDTPSKYYEDFFEGTYKNKEIG